MLTLLFGIIAALSPCSLTSKYAPAGGFVYRLSSGGFPDPIVMVDFTGAGDVGPDTAEWLYYLKDALGSVAALADADGDVVERYFYEPYGATLVADWDGAPWAPGDGPDDLPDAWSPLSPREEPEPVPIHQIEPVPPEESPGNPSRFGNPLMWTGQRLGPPVGLYEFPARGYGPATGRFLQRDPIGVLDSAGEPYFGGQGTAPYFGPPDVAAQSEYLNSFNLYLYVNASPLNGTDPTGRWDEYDDLIAELTGHKVAALGYIQEAAAATVIGANVAIDIAGALMGVDFFKAFGNIVKRKGTVSDWVQIGAATLGTGYVAYKAIKWGRKINKVRKFRNAIEIHHLLPREFAARFSSPRIRLSIDDFVIDLERWRHRLKPRGVHTGSHNWNKRWKQFFDDFDTRGVEPMRKDVLEFLAQLRREFGV